MHSLKRGEYFGQHNRRIEIGLLLITDTQYTHPYVDWHYHENPYFTFLLRGKLSETNRRSTHYLEAGSLLFHNSQDPHTNTMPNIPSRGFHIELSPQWFAEHQLDINGIEGSLSVQHPRIKQYFNTIFLESFRQDQKVITSLDFLLLDIFSQLNPKDQINCSAEPKWVSELKEMLKEPAYQDLPAKALARLLGIHPVHLSRCFHRHFGTSFSQYIRSQRLNEAVSLMLNTSLSLGDIAHRCGFFDQSHFISNFRQVYRMTPRQFLRKVS